MKILIFLDSLIVAPKYLRLFGDKVSFIVPGTPSSVYLFVEALKLLRRGECLSMVRILKLWFTRRIYLASYGLSDSGCLTFIKSLQPHIALHGMGVIYPRCVINACGAGILNAHIGKLPDFRGRSVMEWTLFVGKQTGVTVFFIDEGIDTGSPLIFFRSIDVSYCKSVSDAKAKLFDMAPHLYHESIINMNKNTLFVDNDLTQGRRYYEMSSLFCNVLETNIFSQNK